MAATACPTTPQKLQDWVGAQSGSIPVAANFQNTVSNTALSPDGLPNYGLRSIPRYQAGVNTPDSIIDVNDTRLLARGFNVGVLSPDHTEGRVQDWNLTLEKEIFSNTVLRVGYVGNYGDNQQQEIHYNDETPAYIWYATRRAPLPTGPFASVATRPYDQQAYGDITLYSPTGYARYNGLEVELQQRFSRGISYQIFWNVGNTLLVNQDTDDTQSIEAMPSIERVPAWRRSHGREGTEPLPELQARSEYAETPDPLELYSRITVRKREALLRQ